MCFVFKPKTSTNNIHFNSLRHVGRGIWGLQCRDSTTYSHFNSQQHVGDYSINTLQSILILTAYGSLGGYNIKLLQIIAIWTAYNTLVTLQRKLSTTIRQPRAFLGRYSEKPLQPILFSKVYDINIQLLQTHLIPKACDTILKNR